MKSSKAMLEKMSSEIEKSMERVETREKYLNTQLSSLLKQYSKTQEQLKQTEDKYSKLSGKWYVCVKWKFSKVLLVRSVFVLASWNRRTHKEIGSSK